MSPGFVGSPKQAANGGRHNRMGTFHFIEHGPERG